MRTRLSNARPQNIQENKKSAVYKKARISATRINLHEEKHGANQADEIGSRSWPQNKNKTRTVRALQEAEESTGTCLLVTLITIQHEHFKRRSACGFLTLQRSKIRFTVLSLTPSPMKHETIKENKGEGGGD